MPFTFKYFYIEDQSSTMKVGTDSMVLGAWANPGKSNRILDIGTGCGVLSLMMAQKSSAIIDAIDPDIPSASEAAANFRNSLWNERLHSFSISFQLFSFLSDHRYDYIITNPPFYSNHLKPASFQKRLAKHTDSLSPDDLFSGSQKVLKPEGILAMILPANMHALVLSKAANHDLFPIRMMTLHAMKTGPPIRVLVEFSRIRSAQIFHSKLWLYQLVGKYSSGYLRLTDEFHQFPVKEPGILSCKEIGTNCAEKTENHA